MWIQVNKYRWIKMKNMTNLDQVMEALERVDRNGVADPPLDDIRDVLDWMHTEVATSSQAGIIEPRDRDRLLALAGRVEAWLVEQGEA